MDENKANQMIALVEDFYHKHKKDTFKPKIWDLILTIRYLAHKVRELNHRVETVKYEVLKTHEKFESQQYIPCNRCGRHAIVIFENEPLCEKCAVEEECCIGCGNKPIEHLSVYCRECIYGEEDD